MMKMQGNIVYFVIFGLNVAMVLPKAFHGEHSMASDVYNPGTAHTRLLFGDCLSDWSSNYASRVEQTIYNMGAGNISFTYGDFGYSAVTLDEKKNGSGDINKMSENRDESTRDVPNNAGGGGKWPQRVYNQGAGHVRIKYGNCSSSNVVQNLYNYGLGDIRIVYSNFSSSNVAQSIFNFGKGDIRLVYGNSSALKVAQDIKSYGSGDIRIVFENSSTLESYKVINMGSGDVFITCSASDTDRRMKANMDQELAQSVLNMGSGSVFIRCGNRRYQVSSTSSLPSIGSIGTIRNRLQIQYNTEASSSLFGIVPDVYNRGDKDLHLKYGDCGASYMIQNTYNDGSGTIYFTYGFFDDNRVNLIIKNYGSGDIFITFGNMGGPIPGVPSNTSTSESTPDVSSNASTSESTPDVSSNASSNSNWPGKQYQLGSGDFYIQYGACRATYYAAQYVEVHGSGDTRLVYANARSVKAYDIYVAGSGDVYMTCSTEVPVGHNVVNVGSGKVHESCGNGR